MIFCVLSLLAFGALCAAVPVQPSILHEKRNVGPYSPWTKGARLEQEAILPMRVGLKQSNLEKAMEHLMEMSVVDEELVTDDREDYYKADHIPRLQSMGSTGPRMR